MNLVTAISAQIGRKQDLPDQLTYANIVLRPAPRRGVKYSPVKLSVEEQNVILRLLGGDLRKWWWVVGREHTKYIYTEEENHTVKITSVSGFYSGQIFNKFNVIDEMGKSWLKVETLKAGTDWWKQIIPPHLLHHVYSFRGALPKCGDVILPVITATGYGWIERRQTCAGRVQDHKIIYQNAF